MVEPTRLRCGDRGASVPPPRLGAPPCGALADRPCDPGPRSGLPGPRPPAGRDRGPASGRCRFPRQGMPVERRAPSAAVAGQSGGTGGGGVAVTAASAPGGSRTHAPGRLRPDPLPRPLHAARPGFGPGAAGAAGGRFVARPSGCLRTARAGPRSRCRTWRLRPPTSRCPAPRTGARPAPGLARPPRRRNGRSQRAR